MLLTASGRASQVSLALRVAAPDVCRAIWLISIRNAEHASSAAKETFVTLMSTEGLTCIGAVVHLQI